MLSKVRRRGARVARQVKVVKAAIKVNITNETVKAKAISLNHKSGSRPSNFLVL